MDIQESDRTLDVAAVSASFTSPWQRLVMAATIVGICTAGPATLFGFTGRWGWPWELFCHFRAQYLGVLAAATIAAWACRRKRWAALAFVLAVTNLVLVAPLYVGPGPGPIEKPVLRAMSFNVHYLNHEPHRTIELVQRENPDIIIMIEVTAEWAEAMRVLEVDYPYSRAFTSEDPGGIAIYSKLKISDMSIRGRVEPFLLAVIARVELPGRHLNVIGAHPGSPSSNEDFIYRNRQLEALARLAANQVGPTMVLGDLNTTSWSPNFQSLIEVSGLQDSRQGFGVQGSWPWLPWPVRIPIDHCLVSGEIGVLGRRVGPAVGSDHRPIFVDFFVREDAKK